MNVYLDIDRVLLANENKVASYADEFLQAILTAYPDSTYWLTTHNQRDENRAKEILISHLKPETVSLLDKIKPSVWNEMKTDGINFSEKFIWLDDDLWEDELKVLEQHNATENFILIDFKKNPDQLKTIAELL